MNEYQLAKAGLSKIMLSPEILNIGSWGTQVTATFGSPYEIMQALSRVKPKSFATVFLDLPRASKREKAWLPKMMSDGDVEWSEAAHDDPDYLFRLKANCIVSVKLAVNCLHSDGLLIAIATPDTYMAVRGAIEQCLGDKSFIGELVYQIRQGGGNDSRWMSNEHETLLIHALSPAPDHLPRFTINKTAQQLNKYKKEDEVGRFYWDTYIRKQARNYYPIECPDGSILQNDKNKQPISWLWKEETFKEKLRQGEVKFGKGKHGEWRLYFKDREKTLTILRSLILNKTDLSDVTPEAMRGSSGRGLLTQDGSKEIESYKGNKPEYLKSSNYFRFILDIFGQQGNICFPFPDYGAAIPAVFGSDKNENSIFINNDLSHKGLIEWRLKTLSQSDRKSAAIGLKLDRFNIIKLRERSSELCSFLRNFALCQDGSNFEWFEVNGNDIHFSIGDGESLNLVIHSLPTSTPDEPIESWSNIVKDRGLDGRKPLVIWSIYNATLIAAFIDLPEGASIKEFPTFFFEHSARTIVKRNAPMKKATKKKATKKKATKKKATKKKAARRR